jgi:hypothetical protein
LAGEVAGLSQYPRNFLRRVERPSNSPPLRNRAPLGLPVHGTGSSCFLRGYSGASDSLDYIHHVDQSIFGAVE